MEPLPPPVSDPVPLPALPIAPTTLEYESARLAPGKGGLIAMSLIFFCIGGLTGLVILGIAFFLTRSGLRPDLAAGRFAALLAMYGSVAAACIWTGVGCCRARRWVRPLVLAGAWPWLGLGCVILLFMSIDLVQQEQPSGSVIPFLMAASMLVGLPALIVVFFQRRQTGQTLWFYDPIPGWADRCPIPVLAFSLWTALGALVMLVSLVRGSLPILNVPVVGAVASAAVLLAAASLLCASIGAYGLKPWAWWMSLAQSIMFPAASLTLALRGQLHHYAYVMQTPPTTGPTLVQALQPLNAPWLPLTIILAMLVWIGILLGLCRYFPLPPASASPPAA